jgi:hypothetical protein
MLEVKGYDRDQKINCMKRILTTESLCPDGKAKVVFKDELKFDHLFLLTSQNVSNYIYTHMYFSMHINICIYI